MSRSLAFLYILLLFSAAWAQGPGVEELNRQVDELWKAKRYAEAVPVAKRLSEECLATFGPAHGNTLNSLEILAQLKQLSGDLQGAESVLKSLLNDRERILGEHADTGRTSGLLADVYLALRQPAKAEPHFIRCVSILEKTNPNSALLASRLFRLGELYRDDGNYASAEPLFVRALAIAEANSEPWAVTCAADSLISLARIHLKQIHFERAEFELLRALALFEKSQGPEGRDTAVCFSFLAELYKQRGENSRAEPLLRRAVAISEKTCGPTHTDTAGAIINLASLLSLQNNLAEALPLYERAVAIREAALGEHPETAEALGKLAKLYLRLGEYVRAEPILQRVLSIREATQGREHLKVSYCLSDLAQLYWRTGDLERAERLEQRSLQISEKLLGPEHPDVAASLTILGYLSVARNDYKSAQPLFERAFRIVEKAYEASHPQVGAAANNLARVHAYLGDNASAQRLFRRALAITEKAQGPDHLDTAICEETLASSLIPSPEALTLAVKAMRIREKFVANVLSFASERQRLSYQATENPYVVLAAIGDAPELATAVLRHKGLVLDSLLEDLEVARRAGLPALEKLRRVKDALIAERDPARQTALERDAELLERQLARHASGRTRRALGTEVAQVKQTLAQGTALVEFVRYRSLREVDKYFYGAVVLRSQGPPQWVSLGSAEPIEAQVGEYQRAVRGAGTEAALSTLLRSLYTVLWAPLEGSLKGVKTVIVGPDGALSTVSMATLVTPEDTFLGQRFELRYVASGRDLLAQPKSNPQGPLVAVGNPDFGAPVSKGSQGLRSIQASEVALLAFPPLPGTLRECTALQSLGAKKHWTVRLLTGKEASESALRQLRSPRILHLATHGFFLPAAQVLVNPMQRSGVALAGATSTLRAGAREQAPAPDQDGILTAEEVGSLNLEGTWLVTLSACETGLGEVRAGEGVLGLRRGFVQSGAQNLLMTLWPVADRFTPRFMEDFYSAAAATGAPSQALAQVQTQWLVRLRQERGLATAVNLAGAFILTFQGRP